MNNAKKRDLFLGGNTSKGFYNLFDNLISQEEANRIVCLKGGPGTGKSSLMKKVGFHFLTEGYDVELFHCSSDDQSLDGVLVKGLNVAIVDGTAPHIVDPINPGAVDNVVNLADGLDSDSISKNKKEIMSYAAEIGDCFKRAYTYFGACKHLYEDWIHLNELTLDENSIDKFTESLKNMILPIAKISNLGKERHLFATAFTPNGIVSYTKNIAESVTTKYIIKGEPGLYKNTVLRNLGRLSQTYGYNVEYFHNPLIPSKLEHIIIPELGVGVFSRNELSKVDLDGTIYNMEDFCDKTMLKSLNDEIEFNKIELDILLNKGLSLITKAKLIHDELEKFYVSNMDFNLVNDYYSKIVSKFESYK